MSCSTRSGSSPWYASMSCGRAWIASSRNGSTLSSSVLPHASGSSSGEGSVEVQGFTSAPVSATLSAKTGGIA